MDVSNKVKEIRLIERLKNIGLNPVGNGWGEDLTNDADFVIYLKSDDLILNTQGILHYIGKEFDEFIVTKTMNPITRKGLFIYLEVWIYCDFKR